MPKLGDHLLETCCSRELVDGETPVAVPPDGGYLPEQLPSLTLREQGWPPSWVLLLGLGKLFAQALHTHFLDLRNEP